MERQILEAAEEGDLPTVQRILQQRAAGAAVVNLNATGGLFRSTALHRAAFRGHLRIVQAFLQTDGVQVDARDRDLRTPLHLAGSCGQKNPRVVQALLDAGADPNAACRFGSTPLHFAVSFIAPMTIVEALLDGGADPVARDSYNGTPLHAACKYGHLEAVQVLIRRQGSECLTVVNSLGETPLDFLRYASPDQKEEVVRIGKHILHAYAGLLVQSQGIFCLHSVLQNAVFADGETFQLPVGKLSTEHLQTLLEYLIVAEPGSLRSLDANGLLPLQAACQLQFPDLVINVVLRPYPGALLQL